MAEVLVVVEATQAFGVKKVTLEMLTIARSLGDVSAVVLGVGHVHLRRAVLRQFVGHRVGRAEHDRRGLAE